MSETVKFTNNSGIVLSGPISMIREGEEAEVPKEYYDWYVSRGWAPELKPAKSNPRKKNASNKKTVDDIPSFLG